MANDFVVVNRSTTFGANLVELSNILRRAKELATATQERMNHMHDGVTFTPITVNYGLAQNSAAGQAALGIIDDVVDALATAGITTMIERVG